MYLVHASLHGVAPFGDLDVPFVDPEGAPRLITIIHGGAGVGKTSLLTAIVNTRPGQTATPASLRPAPDPRRAPHTTCEWLLGDDDTDRPHPLSVASPHSPHDPTNTAAVLRRREQALFDRRAKERGFVCVAFAGTRWFSRQPVSLHAPLRAVARHDPRTTTPLDDANRFDLSRETKQALAYAAISSALAPASQRARVQARRRSKVWRDTRLLGTAVHETTDAFVGLAGFGYHGLDAVSLEPLFAARDGELVPFDGLPTRVRHLAAFAALTVRALWAAYPDRDPRTAQGLVAIDDADLRQDTDVLAALVPTLRLCLPRVQWILTTASAELATSCAPHEVLALRRMPEHKGVQLFCGSQAQTH